MYMYVLNLLHKRFVLHEVREQVWRLIAWWRHCCDVSPIITALARCVDANSCHFSASAIWFGQIGTPGSTVSVIITHVCRFDATLYFHCHCNFIYNYMYKTIQ